MVRIFQEMMTKKNSEPVPKFLKSRITVTINIRKFVRTWDRPRVGRVRPIVRERRLGNRMEGWRGHKIAVS